MKRTPLHRQSPKTRQRQRAASAERREFVASVGVCEVCSRREATDAHEITRGKFRQRALTERCARLAVCRLCNCGPLTDAAKWPMEKQLAALFLSRPEDYDRLAVNAIRERAPDAISETEVLAAVVSLLYERLS